jgi:hypothetical protein
MRARPPLAVAIKSPFPDAIVAHHASFNKFQLGTLDFVLAWSRQDVKKAEEEQARRLGLCVNLEKDDYDAGPSQWRGGQGCST